METTETTASVTIDGVTYPLNWNIGPAYTFASLYEVPGDPAPVKRVHRTEAAARNGKWQGCRQIGYGPIVRQPAER